MVKQILPMWTNLFNNIPAFRLLLTQIKRCKSKNLQSPLRSKRLIRASILNDRSDLSNNLHILTCYVKRTSTQNYILNLIWAVWATGRINLLPVKSNYYHLLCTLALIYKSVRAITQLSNCIVISSDPLRARCHVNCQAGS